MVRKKAGMRKTQSGRGANRCERERGGGGGGGSVKVDGEMLWGGRGLQTGLQLFVLRTGEGERERGGEKGDGAKSEVKWEICTLSFYYLVRELHKDCQQLDK